MSFLKPDPEPVTAIQRHPPPHSCTQGSSLLISPLPAPPVPTLGLMLWQSLCSLSFAWQILAYSLWPSSSIAFSSCRPPPGSLLRLCQLDSLWALNTFFKHFKGDLFHCVLLIITPVLVHLHPLALKGGDFFFGCLCHLPGVLPGTLDICGMNV